MALNYREEAFVDEFFKNDGNCYAAAIAAGYAEKTARYASEWINEKNQEKPTKKNVYKPELVAAIEARREQLMSERVADAQEIMEFHTRVLRGKEKDAALVVVGIGDGYSKAETVEVAPSLKTKQTSASALAKFLGLEKANLSVDGAVPVIFTGVDDLED
ncbi:MAG: terminase small subunit [Clostridia bacterium]|nr:terminase small subunit [Clostridia bacterium]